MGYVEGGMNNLNQKSILGESSVKLFKNPMDYEKLVAYGLGLENVEQVEEKFGELLGKINSAIESKLNVKE